jgi:uncharacterized coiled-coil protein SlyX
MQQAIDKAKQVITAAMGFIQNQKQTIAELRAQLAQVSTEFTQFQEAETAEDAEQAALLTSLNEALSGLESETQG